MAGRLACSESVGLRESNDPKSITRFTGLSSGRNRCEAFLLPLFLQGVERQISIRPKNVENRIPYHGN